MKTHIRAVLNPPRIGLQSTPPPLHPQPILSTIHSPPGRVKHSWCMRTKSAPSPFQTFSDLSKEISSSNAYIIHDVQ